MQNSLVGIFGQKGTGKTTLCRSLLRLRWPGRILVIDSLGHDYPKLELIERGVKLACCFSRRSFRVRVVPPADSQARSEWLDSLLGFVWAVGDVLLVVDEIRLYQGSGYIPASLDQLVLFGRHKQIDLIYVAWRPPEVHRDLLSQTDLFYLFRVWDSRDLDYFDRNAVSGFSDKIRALRLHQWLKLVPPNTCEVGGL